METHIDRSINRYALVVYGGPVGCFIMMSFKHLLWRHFGWLSSELGGSCASLHCCQVDYHSLVIESDSQLFLWLACNLYGITITNVQYRSDINSQKTPHTSIWHEPMRYLVNIHIRKLWDIDFEYGITSALRHIKSPATGVFDNLFRLTTKNTWKFFITGLLSWEFIGAC